MDLRTIQLFNRIAYNKPVITREIRIRREGSPPFVWIPGAINAAATAVIEVGRQFPASRKYEPLDSVEIVNNESSNNLTVTLNGTLGYYVPAGTIRLVHGRGVALWHIAVQNDGAAVTTLGNIVLTLQKEPYTIDKLAADNVT